MVISGKTGILGVIGHPIGHSLSPVMHNAALANMIQSGANADSVNAGSVNVDFVYVAFPIAPENLGTAMAGFEAIGLRGLSVTIPHKQAVMQHLVSITEVAQAIGAVNTVWKEPDGWHGTNTDMVGFIAPLVAMQRDWSQSTAICLGNGGAARAVVAGCAELGFRSIQVVGRDLEKLQAFQSSFQSVDSIRDRLSVHSWNELENLLPNANVMINSTPIGMAPKIEASPLNQSQTALIQPGSIAYDLIYTPSPTQFLQQAAERGAIAIDGLEMLVQQGAAALKIWTGCEEIPVGVMRRSLQEKLGLVVQ